MIRAEKARRNTPARLTVAGRFGFMPTNDRPAGGGIAHRTAAGVRLPSATRPLVPNRQHATPEPLDEPAG